MNASPATASSASTPPPTPSTTGPGTAGWSEPTSTATPPSKPPPSRSPTPATAGLPQDWTRTDELYNFRSNPRGRVHVLATLDERTYTGGTMGYDHPIAWCQSYGGGRSFYTGLGHTEASYSEPLFRQHLLGGIRYAAGAVPASASALTGED